MMMMIIIIIIIIIIMDVVRTKIGPVTIGALGTTKKGLDQNLQLLPGHLTATELQVTLMSTAHIICKVLG